MSFSVGIVGLPNVGKSTLFKALTKTKVDIASYPFTTIHPNYGVVAVPDERLEKIAGIIKPEKITPTVIEFIDIAGLVKGAHKGEGLGNQFLSQIRSCDAIVEVVRFFEDQGIENVLGEINPEKEAEVVKTELLMKDLETLDGLLVKMEKELKAKDKKAIKKAELIKKIKDWVSRGKLIYDLGFDEEEKEEIKEYQFLTQKPSLYILNVKGESQYQGNDGKGLTINLKDEADISELSAEENQELGLKSNLGRLILNCYNILNLITFFTVAGLKETRAWTLKQGSNALEAAGAVHSDFKEKFIRAEVISWKSLLAAGGWSKARELGWLKIEGKDYLVQDGDVIEFKI